MSAQVEEYAGSGGPADGQLALAPEPVEVRRNAVLMGVVGALAAAVAIAYLSRAAAGGSAWDWAVMGGTALVAVLHLAALVDSRTPLLVADAQGVRMRLGRTWRGLPWSALRSVEHTPRRWALGDGRLALVPHTEEKLLAELDPRGRRQARLASRLYGAPLAVPLGPTTRTSTEEDRLTEALRALAGSGVEVVTVVPAASGRAADHDDAAADDAADDAVEPGDHLEPVVPVEQDGPAGHVSWSDPVEPAGSREARDSAEPVDQPDPVAPAAGAAGNGLDGSGSARPGATPRWHDPRPAVAGLIGSAAGLLARRRDRDPADPADPADQSDWIDQPDPTDQSDGIDQPAATGDEVAVHESTTGEAATEEAARDAVDGHEATTATPASPTPEPSRQARLAQRVQRTRTPEVAEAAVMETRPTGRVLRRPGSISLVEDTEAWGDRVRPIARAGSPVAPLVIDEFAAQPADDPVVGPELRAARTRLGLTVDGLAERTRIRPHVIESMEVDDFAPCGGDFYARGHLRTLARVLGLDVAPLLTQYDERYAHAPISPRRVFEAELATGSHGGIRGTRGGPNWSVLVAAVMAVVLAWSVARLVMDEPAPLQGVPSLRDGSGGVATGATAGAETMPVLLRAATGGARVVVEDGNGKTVFTGDLSYGATRSLDVVPPVRVESSDGGVEVVADGVEKGQLGETGQPAAGTFVAR